MNPITFSTLACPEWNIATVIAKASEYGYDGLEWRGGPQGHVQPSMSTMAKSSLRQQCMDAGLRSWAVTAYTHFASHSRQERQSNVDELCRYVDLGAELGAHFVRTFLGELPAGVNLEARIYRELLDCLNVAAAYADSTGIKIAIEPHDDFVQSSSIAPLFNQNSHHPALFVIWDLGNAFAAGENPVAGFEVFKNHLAYVQVKDGQRINHSWQLCSLGAGDIPLRQIFDLLSSNNYQGPFSVEWEYAWHPELDPPEIALPAALQTVKELLSTVQQESA